MNALILDLILLTSRLIYCLAQSPLMDMVYSANDYCVRTVRRSIVETESIPNWQEFHILGEYAPATSIIIGAGIAV